MKESHIMSTNFTMSNYSGAIKVENSLGNPFVNSSKISFRAIMSADRKEDYPEEMCDVLNEIGVNEFYIPKEFGGYLANIEELSMILRVLSRRDLTLSIAHAGKLLGLIPIWLGNSMMIKKKAAKLIRGNRKIAFGLTEYNHGSDILNNEFTAKPYKKGYILNGKKWLISHATIGDAITILAKTDNKSKARNYSLFFVEKSEIDKKKLSYIPKIRTLGVRGLDMSGIEFHKVFISKEFMISQQNKGLDLTLKGLQFTRNLCSAFSLGAIDTLLRTVYPFSLKRKLYNNYIINIPYVKDAFCETFITIILADCFARGVNRAFHFLPEQCSLLSSTVKAILPELIENQIKLMSKFAGARFYLEDDYANGIIQKILRDNPVIGLGDGNTAVNLHAVILQIDMVFNRQVRSENNVNDKIIKSIYDANVKLPDLDFNLFKISNLGKDDLINGIYEAHGYFQNSSEKLASIIVRQIEIIIDEYEKIKSKFINNKLNLTNVYSIPASYFLLAKKFGFVHIAESCLNTFIHNKEKKKLFMVEPYWVTLCLNKVLLEMGLQPIETTEVLIAKEEVFKVFDYLYSKNFIFSIFPFELSQ